MLCVELHTTDVPPKVVSNLPVSAKTPVTFRSVSFLFALVSY